MAGLKTIPAIREYNDEQIMEVALVENLQRGFKPYRGSKDFMS